MTKELIYIDNMAIEVLRKRIKNINLRIGIDKRITISANSKIGIKKLEEFVKLKRNWINKNINKIESYNKNVRNIEYISGEKIRIQENNYILNVIPSDKNKVQIKDNFINLYVTDITNYNKRKSTIDKFMMSKALELFEESLSKMLDVIKIYGVNRPIMKIRKMKSRWGSCNKIKNKITINYELIKVSKDCLEYVILHELIHFLVSGHNKLFYNYMSILMPDWKSRKKSLSEEHIY
jgi:predicted metal-dependent hydrolase